MNIGAHFTSGAAPRIGFVKLAEAVRTPAPAPLFVFGPANRTVFAELFGQTAMHAIGCYTLSDAVVAPTGVAIKDGMAFSSAAFIHPSHHVDAVARRLFAAGLPERHVRGPLAVIYGPGHETFGHWLADFLPRLWVLSQAGFDVFTLRYAVPPNLSAFAMALLARLGLRESQMVPYRYWREMLRTDLLLMPTGLRADNRMSPLFGAATAFWTRALVRTCGGGGSARLFLSRETAPAGRVLTNRAAIETLARRRGYAVVRPESMGLTEQAAMFAGARVVVGEYGSALHGTVYARPGTVSVALRGTARHPSFVQSGIAGALGQHVGYVLGRTKGEVEQRFTVQAEDFERALDIAEGVQGV